MPLEIVSRGPDTELDRKIAILAEVLECTPEFIVDSATNISGFSTDSMSLLLIQFLYRLHDELARHTPNRVSLP